jgi:integrase
MREKTRGIVERVSGSGIWWIRWTDHEGKRHFEKAGRRSDAVTLLAKRQHEKLLRRKLPERLQGGSTLTFGQLAQDALAHSTEENGERSTKELALKLAIISEAFDHRPAEGISKQDIQDWLLEQTEERKWSAATRNRYQAAFSLVFRVAVDNEKLTINPASRIKRKAEHNDRIRFLSPKEEVKLTKIVRENWPEHLPALMISLHTGMRASEQFGLQWSDVSLTRKSITLSHTKAGRTRHVALNAIALEAFKTLKGTVTTSSGPVFLYEDGNPVHTARGWFETAVEMAELKDYTWHCNRHTFASRLVMAGVDIRTVAQLMGHSTIQMTMRYAHLAPEHTQAAVDRLVSPSARLATKSVTNKKSNREKVL